MNYTKEQLENILALFPSVEAYEERTKYENAINYLKDTDYITNKIVEYQILGLEIKDYTEILQKREEARNVIRELEN